MQDEDKRSGSGIAKALSALVVVAAVAALLWGSDRITMQGERTIYTVLCEGGAWNGNACSGKLAPDKRYAFRASKVRREVLYWVRGSDAPSGRYGDCAVVDRDNWKCNVAAGGTPTTIAYEMAHGRPTRADAGLVLPYHSVPKWKWWLIDAGIGGFRNAGE